MPVLSGSPSLPPDATEQFGQHHPLPPTTPQLHPPESEERGKVWKRPGMVTSWMLFSSRASCVNCGFCFHGGCLDFVVVDVVIVISFTVGINVKT